MSVVLFVCTANTCRSVMMQAIFSQWLGKKGISDVCVDSAGLFKNDEHINPNAISVLEKHSINITSFIPKEVDANMINGADYVICMTCEQAQYLREKFGTSNKIACICEIIGHDVSDPYQKGIEAYESTFSTLQDACTDIYDKILK